MDKDTSYTELGGKLTELGQFLDYTNRPEK